jgi:hypothetical protein
MTTGQRFNVCLFFLLACLWLGFIFLVALANFNP